MNIKCKLIVAKLKQLYLKAPDISVYTLCIFIFERKIELELLEVKTVYYPFVIGP